MSQNGASLQNLIAMHLIAGEIFPLPPQPFHPIGLTDRPKYISNIKTILFCLMNFS